MATFTREQLEAKTAIELKSMCVNDLNLPGLTKKNKETVMMAILENYGAPARRTKSAGRTKFAEMTKPEEMNGIEFMAQSAITKPSESFGNRTTTTVHVSCGASSGNFPVAGRTVKEVGEFLREVLNVDSLSTGLVNGKDVDASYVITPGDNLEFLKPAGKKG